jgi:hypothetical protein
MPCFPHRTLPFAGAGRKALHESVYHCAPRFFAEKFLFGKIRLKKAHRAFDVYAHGTWIDMCRRGEDAADRRSVSRVCIRIEDYFGDPGSKSAIYGLLQALFVEGGANTLGANDRNGSHRRVRNGENSHRFFNWNYLIHRTSLLIFTYCLNLPILPVEAIKKLHFSRNDLRIRAARTRESLKT